MSEKTVKGYKVFNPDWTCRGFQYKVGEYYERDENPIVCKRGFHFCERLEDCFNYYDFDSENKVAEITAYGEIVVQNNKCCTNKIKIEKELSWYEVLSIVNIGKHCTGIGNSGNWNSGNWNSGSWNSGNGNAGDRNSGGYNAGDYNSGDYNSGGYNAGDYNSGDYNSGGYNAGDYNSGDYNSGGYNAGDYNSGGYNSGDFNSGNWNSGSWNTTDCSSGCFNTVEQKIFLFNRLSDWTMKDWRSSKARDILYGVGVSPVQKIYEVDMADKEKKEHPKYQITGFYLKKLSLKEIAEERQKCWDKLSQEQKDIVMAIPNFDKAIFKETTGIDVDMEE